MAEVLILDSEALSALASAHRRQSEALRARAVLQVARDLRAPVRVPAPVLAEVCRGGARDAAVNRVLAGGIVVVDLTAVIARRAGALLTASRFDSSHAVDAFVVATAEALGKSIVATHDPDDLERLASHATGVRILEI